MVAKRCRLKLNGCVAFVEPDGARWWRSLQPVIGDSRRAGGNWGKAAHFHYGRVVNYCWLRHGHSMTLIQRLWLALADLVLVVHAGGLPREIVQRVKTKLDQSQARILGVVLNRVDIEREQPYYYYYNYSSPYYGSPTGVDGNGTGE